MYKNADVICKDNGKYVYLLLRGKADIFKKLGEGMPAKKVVKIEEGTVFGEMSLIESKSKGISIIAGNDNTIVMELEKNNYRRLLKEDSEIAYMLLRTLIIRIDSMMDKLIMNEPAFIFQMRNNDIYKVVNTMGLTMFQNIVSCNEDYPIMVLTELNNMFEELSKSLATSLSKREILMLLICVP